MADIETPYLALQYYHGINKNLACTIEAWAPTYYLQLIKLYFVTHRFKFWLNLRIEFKGLITPHGHNIMLPVLENYLNTIVP